MVRHNSTIVAVPAKGGHSVITHGRRMEYQRSHSMFLTRWIAGTAGTSWSDRASLPRKRAGNAISPGSKKATTGGVRIEPGWSPPHGSFVRLLIAPKTQNPRPHPRRPGTSPTSAPTSARDPLLYAIQSVRTYSVIYSQKHVQKSDFFFFRGHPLC